MHASLRSVARWKFPFGPNVLAFRRLATQAIRPSTVSDDSEPASCETEITKHPELGATLVTRDNFSEPQGVQQNGELDTDERPRREPKIHHTPDDMYRTTASPFFACLFFVAITGGDNGNDYRPIHP